MLKLTGLREVQKVPLMREPYSDRANLNVSGPPPRSLYHWEMVRVGPPGPLVYKTVLFSFCCV